MPATRIARAVLPPCVSSSATQRSSIMSQSRGVRRRCCIAASIVAAGFGPIGPYQVLQLSSGYVSTRTLLDAIRLAPHAQRQNAERLAGGVHDQHAQLLVVAEVPPVGFQPIERVKERGVRASPANSEFHSRRYCDNSSMSLISTTSTMSERSSGVIEFEIGLCKP